jgi:hypothetical protein
MMYNPMAVAKVSGVEEVIYLNALNMPYDEGNQQVTGDMVYAPCI